MLAALIAVDHTNGDLKVFESGSIMLYLAERDPDAKLLPKVPHYPGSLKPCKP